MLYYLSLYANEWGILNLFKYISFRSIGALMTSIIISLALGPKLIAWLKQNQKKQPIRLDGPPSHLITKQGTPTMGGALILISLTASSVIWSKLSDPFLWIVLLVTTGYGFIGFYDDLLKIRRQKSDGLPGRLKILFQVLIALGAIFLIQEVTPTAFHNKVMIPFFKDFYIDLGWVFFPFAVLVMTGASNAVNLTDGLDGLAAGPSLIATLCFAIIVYATGNHIFATYLHLPYLPGTGELTIFCGALVGACLGFLWFNAPPAMIFMGDTGSLAIGGALGCMSVVTSMEIVLFIIGGLFVMEAISVMMQVSYFKLTKGKRIFLMAPLHHHFEKKGWSESTIVTRFWIVSIVLALIGLSTLKVR